jgi:hypothetical protein
VVSTVNAQVGLLLVVPNGASIPLVASLSYSIEDPYAVRCAFHAGLGKPVEWVFARDLLAVGIRRHEGAGDVRVWPSGADGRVLCIELSSPLGEALFEAPATDVASFLAVTYRLVPKGQEPGHIDIDAELDSLLRAEGDPW